MNNLQDKCRGSLIGGAVGDALGYAVEFSSLNAIRKMYGENGIVNYELNSNGIAEFSDDTQMSLFTAEGLLNDFVGKEVLTDAYYGIKSAYLNWYCTQTETRHPLPNSWIAGIKTLWFRRAPGITCMGALEALSMGRSSQNDSKGCGGVMRVAPIGIFFASHNDMPLPDGWDFYEMLVTAASNAAFITHGHTASSYAAGLTAFVVCRCVLYDGMVDKNTFRGYVESGLIEIYEHVPLDTCWLDFKKLINKAMSLAESEVSDTEAIRELGEGWVADEAIAIAIFSVMRHIDSFEDCIVCAVNHDGDSDSTGAIAGNIIGAILGYGAISKKYLTNLELHDVLLSVADDLGGFSSPEQLKERYVNHQAFNVNKDLLL